MGEPRKRPNVFTIPQGVPFLATLADAFLSGRFGPIDYKEDPLRLADATVYLPTRRAVRAFRDLLIERLGGNAAILPAIRPLGDVSEEDQLLDPAVEDPADRLALPQAIPPLARRLVLARLTLAWGRSFSGHPMALDREERLRIPASAADATRLAADLARLIDDMETAGVSWDAVRGLAPDEYAEYYRLTLDFLDIVATAWPRYLAEIGKSDPSTRRDDLIRRAAARLAGAKGPVVAAGSTGSIPATRVLLDAIANHKHGAVVLPGLDQQLDERGWDAIGGEGAASEGHPQFGLRNLIGELHVARADVEPLAVSSPPLAARTAVLSEAMRPAETLDAWAKASLDTGAALAGIDLILARNEQEEATAIALAMRETLETPGLTAALVTPDRTLARRVAIELGRWELVVDDSAATPLDREPYGVFARLLAEAVTSNADPVRLLSLLKHPLAAFGFAKSRCRDMARLLEIALFRGHRVPGGIAGLAAALARADEEAHAEGARVPGPRRRLGKYDWKEAERLVNRIAVILGPLEAMLSGSGDIGVAEATQQVTRAIAAAGTDHAGDEKAFWRAPGGAALATLLDGLARGEGAEGLAIARADYPSFLSTLMAEIAVSRPAGADPRIHIWGTLEARLQSVDCLILGGLDEGVWPGEVRTDPFLSRSMRAAVGLPPPERRIGLAAHDFIEGMGAPRVIVTRAEKRGGTPTVESRWLQRLRAFVGEDAAKTMAARGARYVGFARRLDRPEDRDLPVQPRPKPPVSERPRRLSITEIEKLVRDPYEIYARYVLGLDELDPLGRAPDYALRGTVMHDALSEFTRAWSGPYDEAARIRLVEVGRNVLARVADFPDVHAVWSIRFASIAKWFIEWEAGRDAAIATRQAEITGDMPLVFAGEEFHLRGRADRIDLRRDGSVDIIDFKTGTPPTAKQVIVGFAPQLGIEVAMAQAGAFGPDFAGKSVENLAWIGLSRVERGKPWQTAVAEGYTADTVGEVTLAQFRALLALFENPDHPYVSRARPEFESRYGSAYDHLARVREWALLYSEEDLSWLKTS
jgi:ATP-dependent helicase/nuclease subunit B